MPAHAKAYKIDSVSARAKLLIRREPYWHKADRNLFLGYRRGTTGGNWIGRYQQAGGKKVYQALGQADERGVPADGVNVLGFDEAVAACRVWRRELGAVGDAGTTARNMTVREGIEDYIAYLYRAKSQSNAYATEKRLHKHIPPAMMATPISKLSHRQVRDWHGDMVPKSLSDDRKRAAMDSANRNLSVLKAALNRAADAGEGAIRPDAWAGVKAFKQTTTARKIFLDDIEARRLVDACPPGAIRDLIQIGLLTGARFGELVAMKAGDINFSTGIWAVKKSKTGERETVLTGDALNLLRRAIHPDADPDDLVFRHPDGRIWDRNNIRPVMKAAVRATGGLNPRTTFYALRHTAISWMLKAGVPAQAISENCGTSVRMIEKHYGHFRPADKRSLIEAAMPTLESAEIIPLDLSGGDQ